MSSGHLQALYIYIYICRRKFAHTEEPSELSVGTDFSQNSTPCIVLQLPCDPHAMFGHGLHPRNACFPLAMVYTNAFLVSGYQFIHFIYGWMFLSAISAGFIAGQDDILQY